METNTVCLNVILVFTTADTLTDELEIGLSVLQLSEFITHFRPTPNVKLFMRRTVTLSELSS